MIIAVSSMGKSGNNIMDSRFGRCSYFYIFDTEKNTEDVIENQGLISSGGAGMVSSRQIINKGVDVVITGALGPNAFDVLNMAGIKAYSCNSINVSSAIEKFNRNELEEIKSSKPSHFGMR